MVRNLSIIKCNLGHKCNCTQPDLFWTPFIVRGLSITISQPTLLIWGIFRLEICSVMIWCWHRFLDLLIMIASSLQRKLRGVSPSRLKYLHGEPISKLWVFECYIRKPFILFIIFFLIINYFLTFPSSSLLQLLYLP